MLIENTTNLDSGQGFCWQPPVRKGKEEGYICHPSLFRYPEQTPRATLWYQAYSHRMCTTSYPCP